MNNCIFCKIASGEIPSLMIWEDDQFMAFLDIHPIKTGHTLIIPKTHHPYIFDLNDADFTNLWEKAKQISAVLKKTFKPKSGKVGVIVYGLDVDHTHIHLVPIDKPGELSFAKAKTTPIDELKLVQRQILNIV